MYRDDTEVSARLVDGIPATYNLTDFRCARTTAILDVNGNRAVVEDGPRIAWLESLKVFVFGAFCQVLHIVRLSLLTLKTRFP